MSLSSKGGLVKPDAGVAYDGGFFFSRKYVLMDPREPSLYRPSLETAEPPKKKEAVMPLNVVVQFDGLSKALQDDAVITKIVKSVSHSLKPVENHRVVLGLVPQKEVNKLLGDFKEYKETSVKLTGIGYNDITHEVYAVVDQGGSLYEMRKKLTERGFLPYVHTYLPLCHVIPNAEGGRTSLSHMTKICLVAACRKVVFPGDGNVIPKNTVRLGVINEVLAELGVTIAKDDDVNKSAPARLYEAAL